MRMHRFLRELSFSSSLALFILIGAFSEDQNYQQDAVVMFSILFFARAVFIFSSLTKANELPTPELISQDISSFLVGQEIDAPSAHWANIVHLSEVLNLLNEDSWDVSDEDLRSKWKEFLINHKGALDAYRELQQNYGGEASRSLLQSQSSLDAEADSWMSTWMQSFSSLVKDTLKGNSPDSLKMVDALNTILSSDSISTESVAEIAELFRNLLKELTYQPTERKETTDVWERMDQAVNELQNLQRRASLARSIVEAVETYGNCRTSNSLVNTVDCLSNLSASLEGLVSKYDTDIYAAQQNEIGESTLLSAFRADMTSSIAAYGTCQEIQGIGRIPCLGQWWNSVLEMETKYTNMDQATLSSTDANMVELLKRMLSLEQYIPGTNPEMSASNSKDERLTLSEVITNAINRNIHNSNDDNSASVALGKVVARLKEFIGKISVFSRLGFSRPVQDSSIKRKLLSDSQNTNQLSSYLQDLNQISQRLTSVLQYRNAWTNTNGQDVLVTRLQNLLAFRRENTLNRRSNDDNSLSSNVGEHIASFLLNRIIEGSSSDTTDIGPIVRQFLQQRLTKSQKRKLLMENPQMGQFTMQAVYGNDTADPHLSALQLILKEKGSKSLKSLGEFKGMASRRLHASDALSMKQIISEIRPHVQELLKPVNNNQRSLRSKSIDKNESLESLKETLKMQEKQNMTPGARSVNKLVKKTFNDAKEPKDSVQQRRSVDLHVLDAMLRRYTRKRLSDVLEDATLTTKDVFNAATGIIAHDLHDYHYKEGMPQEHMSLIELPDDSYEVLSQVGKTVIALSDLRNATQAYTTTAHSHNADLERRLTKHQASVRKDSKRGLLEVHTKNTHKSPAPESQQSHEETEDFAELNDLSYYYAVDPLEDMELEYFYPEDFTPPRGKISDVDPSISEFLLPILRPQLTDLSSESLVSVYELEDPSWWLKQSLMIPEGQHFEYEFNFETQDENAPVHKGLGALMKYHLLQDIQEHNKEDDTNNIAALDLIIFVLGIWTGLFLAFVSVGVHFLKKDLHQKDLYDYELLTDSETNNTLSFHEGSKLKSLDIRDQAEPKIKTVTLYS